MNPEHLMSEITEVLKKKKNVRMYETICRGSHWSHLELFENQKQKPKENNYRPQEKRRIHQFIREYKYVKINNWERRECRLVNEEGLLNWKISISQPS